MFSNDYDHEVRVYVSDGSVAHFTLREMHALYRTWQIWVLFVAGFFIMSTGHPITLPQFDSFWLRMAFWWIALFIYILSSDLYSQVSGAMWHRLFGGPIPLIVLSAPLVLASTFLASTMLTLLFDTGRSPFSVMSWQMNVRNILVAHFFETAALLWLIPVLRARRAQANQGRKITLAGRSFVLSDIGRIKAAEHYLEIYKNDGSSGEIIRERMSTFLEQVTVEDGIQTHRSHWVARRRATGISASNLCLDCGTKIPVARGRQDAVREWVQAHCDVCEIA